MNAKFYLAVSGFIFFVVGLLHVARLFCDWPVQLGPWLVPAWASYFGVLIAWGLSFWAYRLHGR
jgi:hypothetical protein